MSYNKLLDETEVLRLEFLQAMNNKLSPNELRTLIDNFANKMKELRECAPEELKANINNTIVSLEQESRQCTELELFARMRDCVHDILCLKYCDMKRVIKTLDAVIREMDAFGVRDPQRIEAVKSAREMLHECQNLPVDQQRTLEVYRLMFRMRRCDTALKNHACASFEAMVLRSDLASCLADLATYVNKTPEQVEEITALKHKYNQ